MIVVEGPDGAGKSTLINKIKIATGLEVAPRVVSKDAEAMVDLKAWVEDNVSKGWQPLIFDRHRLISEPIYGPLLRDSFEPGFDDPVWFAEMLSKFYGADPVVIYCLPPIAHVWRNVENDEDNRVVAKPETIHALWGAYFHTAMMDRIAYNDVWVYDYTYDRHNIEWLLIDHIKNRLQEYKEWSKTHDRG